ncbi:MAG: hypothetical protein ACI95C_001093 [Pseudohongiellaceae bacterium]|jgi:hypothetical protein
MKIIEINNWLAAIGNVGVLIGIIFLVSEFQQNTMEMQAETRSTISQNYTQISEWFMDKELAEIHARSLRGEPISRKNGEYTRLYSLYQGMFSIFENDWYQYQRGLYEEGDFTPQLARWENVIFNQPEARVAWSISRSFFEAGFRAKMDEIVVRAEEQH